VPLGRSWTLSAVRSPSHYALQHVHVGVDQRNAGARRQLGDIISAVTVWPMRPGQVRVDRNDVLEVQAGDISLLYRVWSDSRLFRIGRPNTKAGVCRWQSSWSSRVHARRGHCMSIAKLPVDIFVQIGLLVLIGMASKNAILIVEYAAATSRRRQKRSRGRDEAAQIRFRPIIMTSLAFIFGVFPLVLPRERR